MAATRAPVHGLEAAALDYLLLAKTVHASSQSHDGCEHPQGITVCPA